MLATDKFTGKERDAETGLDYFGARYYGSNMGRWMNPDPLLVSLGARLGMHLKRRKVQRNETNDRSDLLMTIATVAESQQPHPNELGWGTQDIAVVRRREYIVEDFRMGHPPGDAPTRPGANDTNGGTAEQTAVGIINQLGDSAKSYTPDPAADAAADAIIQEGLAQYQKDVQQQVNDAIQNAMQPK